MPMLIPGGGRPTQTPSRFPIFGLVQSRMVVIEDAHSVMP